VDDDTVLMADLKSPTDLTRGIEFDAVIVSHETKHRMRDARKYEPQKRIRQTPCPNGNSIAGDRSETRPRPIPLMNPVIFAQKKIETVLLS
jgi:hypothetical protein